MPCYRGLGLWCLKPLSTLVQLYRGGQFYWWRKPRVPRENHRPLTSHKHYHIMSFRVHLSEQIPYDVEIESCNMIL